MSLGGAEQHVKATETVCQAFYHILRSIKTHFTQGRLFYTQGPFFCALGPLFCALVREEAIFAVCKRCANEGFACMCKEKKFSPFDECSCFVCLRSQNKQQKISVGLPVCLSGCLAVRTWTFHVDTITFEGVSGCKKNLVGVFYVWNVRLVLKSKVISWSRSWSWTDFRFSQKLCGATPNLVDIGSI